MTTRTSVRGIGEHGEAGLWIMVKPRPVSPKELLVRAFDFLGEWQDRAAARRQLMVLDDRVLHDLALDRSAAAAEYSRPFWKV